MHITTPSEASQEAHDCHVNAHVWYMPKHGLIREDVVIVYSPPWHSLGAHFIIQCLSLSYSLLLRTSGSGDIEQYEGVLVPVVHVVHLIGCFG